MLKKRFKFYIDQGFVRQFIITMFGSLSSSTIGLCYASMEPFTLWFSSPSSEIQMTVSDVSWLVSSIELGELISGIPAAILADRWGRKNVILTTGPACIITWLLAAFTRSLPVLYFVRIVQGIFLGVVFTVLPTYLAEISSKNWRGFLGGQFSVMYYFGILFTYISGQYSYSTHIYASIILPLLLLICFPFAPESPYYYFMVDDKEKAAKTLKWLRKNSDISEEYNEIEKNVKEDMSRKNNWLDLIKTKSDRKALIIVQVVTILRYMSGLTVISAYIKEIFQKSNQKYISPNNLVVMIGIFMLVSACLSSFLSDFIGRKCMLIWSLLAASIIYFIISIYYYLDEKTSLDVSDYSWVLNTSLTVVCVIIVFGLGQLTQVIQAEYFPSHNRALGGGVSNITNSICSFVSLSIFEPINDTFGIYVNFVMYGVLLLFGCVFLAYHLTESAGKSLSEVTNDIRIESDSKTNVTSNDTRL